MTTELMAPEQTREASRITVPKTVGVAAEQQRAIAEIQAALTVAAARPRDEVVALDRIKTACQRVGLAAEASYSFSRGGTDITGPSIRLLEVVANAWGNIQFGWRELSQSNGESTVEAFAWDLETNSKKILTFHVPHKRETKKGSYALTDPRDIYEAVANQASRRTRACMEAVIPRDVIDEAVEECARTLATKVEINAESLKKLAAAFADFGVTREQIEKRIQRRLDAIAPAQFVSLRRIYVSLKDGMSEAKDWFEADATPENGDAKQTAKGNNGAKEKLKKQPEADKPADGKPTLDGVLGEMANAKDQAELKRLHELGKTVCKNDGDRMEIDQGYELHLGRLSQ